MTKKSMAIGALVIILIIASMTAIIANRHITDVAQVGVCQLNTGGCVVPQKLSFFPLSPD